MRDKASARRSEDSLFFAQAVTVPAQGRVTATQNVVVPDSSRYAVAVDGVPGMENTGFAIDVDVTNNIGVWRSV